MAGVKEDTTPGIVVRFLDGSEETFQSNTKHVLYQIDRFGLQPPEGSSGYATGCAMAWFAAGQPGRNGEALSKTVVEELVAEWMKGIADISDAPTRPPTKARP